MKNIPYRLDSIDVALVAFRMDSSAVGGGEVVNVSGSGGQIGGQISGAMDGAKDTVTDVVVFGGDFVEEQETQQGTQQETNANVIRLLKIIRGESWTVAGLMTPTTGSIKAKGRIASLLEVGTGFYPELTGRENIYMNWNAEFLSRLYINI